MSAQNITYPDSTPTTSNRTDELRGGDEVLIWDARTGSYEWHTVADAVERADRMKIRLLGTTFYFDEGCIVDCRLNHCTEAHRAPKPQLEAIEQYDPWRVMLYGAHQYADLNAKRTINS